MTDFASKILPADPDATAPDGSQVRLLLGLARGGMAHFRLEPGQVSTAVAHRTVEEIWMVTGGGGEIWRRQGRREEITALKPGTCLTLPLSTHFQFRAAADKALEIVGATMPPWPGADEAYPVAGRWTPTVRP